MGKQTLIKAKGGEDYYVIEQSSIKNISTNNFRGNLPKVSFVIPTKNSSRTIERCLSSIKKQNYPSLEIIVVDNGSTDNTVDIANKYADKVLFDSGKLGRVRQTGIENAEGEIIGIFDSDIYFPHNNWLIRAIEYFNYAKIIATVWPKNVAPPEGPLFQKLYLNLGNQILEDRIRKRRGTVGGGCALILKSAFFSVGGYDEGVHWGEDFNLALKLRKQGYALVYIEDPIYHDTDMGLSVKGFIKKQIMGMKMLGGSNLEGLNLSTWDIFYENIIVGTRAMARGIVVDKDISWILFPYLLFLRFIVVTYVILDKMILNRLYRVRMSA